MPVTHHAVVIAGAGPTGLMLAAELKLAGIDVAIVERRTGRELVGTRARGLNARSIELLDQRGMAGRFLAAGYTAQVHGFAHTRLDISDFPTRHPYGLALVQNHIERLLLEWCEDLGVAILRGAELTAFTQAETGIDITLADGTMLRTGYLVGCDGGRSTVRKLAGIGFPGSDPTISNLLGEVEFTEQPPFGMRQSPRLHGINRTPEGQIQVIVTEREVSLDREPSLADLSAELTDLYGSDFGVHSPAWLFRFNDASRQAERYRAGRVLLAGDAAHIHYPAGGQGLNLGLQDAVNLGWKLAQVVRGQSPDTLLDTYHAERHPVAARVLRNTMANVALARQDDRSQAAAAVVAELLATDAGRKLMAGQMSGLDIHYDLGPGHPLLGRRMPDLDLLVAGRPTSVFALLHDARPLLLNFGPAPAAARAWTGRVRVAEAETPGPWELPVIGPVPAPTAVLIRPDGHVAWVGEAATVGFEEALSTWFGAPEETKPANRQTEDDP